MPGCCPIEWVVDNKALDALLLAKGLTQRSAKYHEVRMRHIHKFRRPRQ